MNTRLRNNNLADNTTALCVKFHLTLLIGIVTLSYQFDFFLRLDNLQPANFFAGCYVIDRRIRRNVNCLLTTCLWQIDSIWNHVKRYVSCALSHSNLTRCAVGVNEYIACALCSNLVFSYLHLQYVTVLNQREPIAFLWRRCNPAVLICCYTNVSFAYAFVKGNTVFRKHQCWHFKFVFLCT